MQSSWPQVCIPLPGSLSVSAAKSESSTQHSHPSTTHWPASILLWTALRPLMVSSRQAACTVTMIAGLLSSCNRSNDASGCIYVSRTDTLTDDKQVTSTETTYSHCPYLEQMHASLCQLLACMVNGPVQCSISTWESTCLSHNYAWTSKQGFAMLGRTAGKLRAATQAVRDLHLTDG